MLGHVWILAGMMALKVSARKIRGWEPTRYALSVAHAQAKKVGPITRGTCTTITTITTEPGLWGTIHPSIP